MLSILRETTGSFDICGNYKEKIPMRILSTTASKIDDDDNNNTIS